MVVNSGIFVVTIRTSRNRVKHIFIFGEHQWHMDELTYMLARENGGKQSGYRPLVYRGRKERYEGFYLGRGAVKNAIPR
jgi:hypothetical protein